MQFLFFFVLQRNAEALVRRGGKNGIVWLLLHLQHFNWKLSKSVDVCRSYSESKARRFLGHSV